MEKSESIKNLALALKEAQAEMPKAKKSEVNPFFKSKYAPLSEVLPQAIEVLSNHGLSVTQHIVALESGDSGLETMLLHESGEYLSSTMKLYLTKVDSQGQGSATTYARRYALMAIIGMVADEDDDGEKASPKTDSSAYPRRQDLVGAAQLGRLKGLILQAGTTVEAIEEKVGKKLGQLTVKQATDLITALAEKVGEIPTSDEDVNQVLIDEN